LVKTRGILLIIFLAGVFILALPDNGKPVITLNKMHGPSLIDLVGITLLLISWMGSIVIIKDNWEKIKTWLGKRTVYIFITMYLLSAIGITTGLQIESDLLLWLSVLIASVINILLIVLSFLKAN
jgi:hypothetical protein